MATRAKRKIRKKYCPMLDKPCLKDECGVYYDRFDRCSIELLPANLYFLKEEMSESADATMHLAEKADQLIKHIGADAQKKLF
ncbi:hypothetical protein [Desulfogranum marinum]|uniref:hypothetical protein n=1 Tax=Desulfogranum marinum TaxID=453220 RepID=UPI0019656330|nr:hypothetical protein [Desulfogranum marinum]MBM9514712.1 hypothetical protein [Desulfogranum marinum]